MKIGITLRDFYKAYLEKIAKENNVSVTKVCSLILENFLNYNESTKRVPIFKKVIVMKFQKEGESTPEEEEIPDWDQMIKELERTPNNE